MAPLMAEGVPGLEAIHTLTPPSPYAAFVLNDWMNPATGLTQIPHTRLSRIGGLYSRADGADPRVPLNYQTGEYSFARIPRGKTITYEGVVVGSTLSQMRAKLAALETCCDSGLTTPQTWKLITTYNSTYDPAGLVFQANGIPVGFTCDDDLIDPGGANPSPFQRRFVLSFRMRDPRWFVTSSIQAAGYTGGGGSWSGIASGTSAVLTMPGLRPAEPIFEIRGSGTGSATLTIFHTELNLNLNITLGAPLATGAILLVDFNTRLITQTVPSVADRTGYITNLANNNFWWAETVGGSLQVGTNTLTVTGDTWAVKATPAV